MITKQVLEIDYKEEHGLILGWKYMDLVNYLTFFRHIIVVLSENKENTNKFLKTYLKKTRAGDLYTILYYKDHKKLKTRGWKQKMVNNQNTSFESIIKEDPIYGDKQFIMSKVEQQFQQFSEPIVVSIYTENLKDKDCFQSRVQKQRSENKYDFIVGMYGPFSSTFFSFSNHISLIPFVNEQEIEGVQFFFKQLYQSAVIWASVTIQCNNGSINSTAQQSWRNINFNTIQKVYRGPSIQYQKDFLMFYRQKQKQMDYNLVLKLTYVTLQRRKYVSEKQFCVHSFAPFQYGTYNTPSWLKPYHVFGDVWLDENPFKSLTVIKFQPRRQKNNDLHSFFLSQSRLKLINHYFKLHVV